MSTACAMSFTRWKEEEGWNGDERMLSAGRIGRMTATRAGYYLLSLCKAKSTRERICG